MLYKKPITSLRRLLANVKDKEKPDDRLGEAYRIKCCDCQATHIGETGRNLSTRLTQHPGGGYSHTLPIWVCAAQRGRDFEAPDLERGIHFRVVFLERGIKNCGSRLYLQLKIVDYEEAFI